MGIKIFLHWFQMSIIDTWGFVSIATLKISKSGGMSDVNNIRTGTRRPREH